SAAVPPSLFFSSSRRRHTRFPRDWSSDVCSSDLGLGPRSARRAALHLIKKKDQLMSPLAQAMGEAVAKVRVCSCCGNVDTSDPRSEERRVGKESSGARDPRGVEVDMTKEWRTGRS